VFKYFKGTVLFAILVMFSVQSLALDLEVTDYKGKKYQLSDYKGKWVVLNYWATWCPPCRKEIPMLIEYNEARKDVKIFGISDEPGITDEKLSDFIDTYFIDYPIIPITRALVKEFGRPRGLPMTIFISPDGEVAKKYTGMLNKEFLNRVMK
jgi:thiol-disulfide isomerase/thioredoxin